MKIETWPIERVLPYENNIKKHDERQVAGIAASLKSGWDQPIVVDKAGVIIKGHGRRLAAIKLGMKEVPVLVRHDLTPEQVKVARLADNRVALGDIDTALMRLELKNIDLTLLAVIFDAKELDFGTVDLGDMNTGAFIDDVDSAVQNQEASTRAAVDVFAAARVSLTKVLGFKDVLGADEIYYTRFLAQIEAEFGLKGEAAMTAFIKKTVGNLLPAE